jgi:hypothetical protein
MAKGGNRDSAPTRDNATPARKHAGIEKSRRDYRAVKSDTVSYAARRVRYSARRRNISDALVPPKPKELESTTSISRFLA